MIQLVMRDGRLATAAPNGPLLVPLSDDRFAIEGQPGEITFGTAEHSGFERRLPGQRPIRFEWRPAVAPNAELLREYEGDYFSVELGNVLYRVTAADSTLSLRTGTSDPVTLRTAFTDTFIGDGYTVQFTRSGNRVTGFEISNPRARRIGFTRKS